jgi:hypothetical protein
MSSITKANLINELGLFPLKRYIQRKPDKYQQATEEYAAKLRQLYLADLKERQAATSKHKRAIRSEVFRLTNLSADELNGITIDSSSLPSATVGDRVVLIRPDEGANDDLDDQQEPLAHGVIIKVTNKQVRIKLDKPITIKTSNKNEQQAADDLGGENDIQIEADNTAKTNGQDDNDREKPTTSQNGSNDSGEQKSMTIDFRIKFDLKQQQKAHMQGRHDSRFRLVELALQNFAKLKCNQALQRNLLGFYDERLDKLNDRTRVMSFPEIVPKLNQQQQVAVEQALKRRLTLVEGPAGTGKTIVGAHIAANMARLKRARVLVCSPIKETIDKLTELIDRIGGCQMVRLPAATMESSAHQARRDSDIYLRSGGALDFNRCSLDELVDDEIYLQAYARFKDTLGYNHDKLHSQAYRMVTSCPVSRRRELERKIISKANVVGCQIDEKAICLLRGIEFDMLIIDDVQVTSELDCLIAIMTKGIKQVTLLSDTRRAIRLARILKRSQSVSHSSNGTSSQVRRQEHPSLLNNDSSNSSLTRRKRPNSALRPTRQASTLSESVTLQRARISTTGSSSSLAPSLEPGNLFERLLSLGLPAVDMRTQYRCHATISNFFIHHFYAGRLRDDPATNDNMSSEIVTRLVVKEESFSWLPNKKYLTAIYKVPKALAAAQDDSMSMPAGRPANVLEERVGELIDKLVNYEDIREFKYSIGIIYNNRAQLGKSVDDYGAGVKRGTIDGFIGQESDFIVLAASASGGGGDGHESDRLHTTTTTTVGISSSIPCDFRRSDIALNWALTRARLGLFIVLEDDRCLSGGNGGEIRPKQQQVHKYDECNSWRELVKYYATNHLIVE